MQKVHVHQQCAKVVGAKLLLGHLVRLNYLPTEHCSMYVCWLEKHGESSEQQCERGKKLMNSSVNTVNG